MAADKAIGALWNQNKSGQDYMTGTIEIEEGKKIRVIAFMNTRKKNEKEPDWRIYISKPKERTEPF